MAHTFLTKHDRLQTEKQWKAAWITDLSAHTESPASPAPLVFRRSFPAVRKIRKLRIFATAIGICDLYLDGKRVHENFFAPSFTDYDHYLQYDCYEVDDVEAGVHEFRAVVAAGWACGRSTYIQNTNKSRSLLTADRQALLAEIELMYEDGSHELLCTDGRFEVSQDSPYLFADFYDGEVYDARKEDGGSRSSAGWRSADITELKNHPAILPRYGEQVTAHEVFDASYLGQTPSGEHLYEFPQNLSGVLKLEIDGTDGQRIVIRHAETVENGELYVQNLRSAKQEITYICREGRQAYEPRFTYMGFQYIGVTGIEPEQIRIRAVAVYSDLAEAGTFSCSNEDLNTLQRNLVWSGKDNFVDIPTDCPQRDERQGWTGDIALFAPTACFNFDMNRFLTKWLHDLAAEQGRTGSIPFVVPERKGITPSITTSCWGDSCILVPYALYMAYGNEEILRKMYPTMRRYLADVTRWAAIGTPMNQSPYILSLPFQFGDWCAPYGSVPEWLGKGAWVGTAYYYNSCVLMGKIADILGSSREAAIYRKRSEKIAAAYLKKFTDGTGRMPETSEFQTGYVLPLYFGMVSGDQAKVMAERLWKLIEENGCRLNTGFTATPYLLFALADNGYVEEAYRLLLQDENPSWLYQVRHGATTMWEQWDITQEDGTHKEGSMNHYAYGAVGDFFYRRICGLEALEPGYRKFRVKPVIGGGLTDAFCSYRSPFGMIEVGWEKRADDYELKVMVPEGCTCEVKVPGEPERTSGSGYYTYTWSQV